MNRITTLLSSCALLFSTHAVAQTLNNAAGFDPGTGFNYVNSSLLRQSDGKILVGGAYSQVNGTGSDGLIRLNTDGTVDNSFLVNNWTGTAWNPYVNSMALQSDGKIIIGGSFTVWNGSPRSCIARLNSDGTLDTSFDPGDGFGANSELGTQPWVFDVKIQDDGKIVVGGNFTSYDGTARTCMARLNPDGSLDNTFNPEISYSPSVEITGVLSTALLSDGKMVICGIFDEIDGNNFQTIAKLNADGTPDLTFTPELHSNIVNTTPYAAFAKVQSDGKIIVAGHFDTFDGQAYQGLVRINSDGTIDPGFASGISLTLENGQTPVPQMIDIQSDGKILVTGNFAIYDGQPHHYVIRVMPDGTPDYGFGDLEIGAGFSNTNANVVLSNDNNSLFIAGDFSSVQGEPRQGIAKLDACGSFSVNEQQICGSFTWDANSQVYTQTGTYYHTETDNVSGCDSVMVLKLTIPESLPAQEICIVGLDSLTNSNRVVWEKSPSEAIDSFYVYRETSVANVYAQIGATDYDDPGVFIDLISNPAVQPYRYKITALDTCGIESAISTVAHKTIHLTINQGTGATWNLLWSSYEGISVPSYRIYRGTSLSTMSLLTTVQGSINSYSDLNAPANVFYQIEFVNANECDPSKSIDYNAARSNIASNLPLGITGPEAQSFSVFPNPCEDVLIVTGISQGTLTVRSMTGAEILKMELVSGETAVPVAALQAGMYFVEIGNCGNAVQRRFVKQ